MDIKDEAQLGFDQMKAAIIGGHDLMAAWCELPDMTHNGNMPHVVVGGVGCLLYCTEAISRAGRMPVVSEDCLNGFLHATHPLRVKACMEAIKATDMAALGRMVAVMTMVIDMNRSRITFNGNLPVLA